MFHTSSWLLQWASRRRKHKTFRRLCSGFWTGERRRDSPKICFSFTSKLWLKRESRMRPAKQVMALTLHALWFFPANCNIAYDRWWGILNFTQINTWGKKLLLKYLLQICSLNTRWSSCNCKDKNKTQSFSRVRDLRRCRSDRGRLCNGIHVQDTDGPERQNKPRDQTVHWGPPGSTVKQVFGFFKKSWHWYSWNRVVFSALF